jgi:hypothetical protein
MVFTRMLMDASPYATKHTHKQQLLFSLFACLIAGISACLYSPYGTIRFSSDHAIHVLMAHDLHLPEDLYYRGQDRLGSLVPMLAFCLHKGLGADPLLAVTTVQYGLLTGTALLAGRYLRTWFYRLLFLIVFFFPLPLFNEHLVPGHPYAAQFFLLFLGMYLHEQKPATTGSKAILFFSGTLILFLSYWISELSLCFLFAYYSLQGLRFFVHRKTVTINRQLLLLNSISTLMAFALICFFIAYAKHHAMRMANYTHIFASPEKWWKGIAQHGSEFLDVIGHMSDAPFKALYALVFCITIGLLTLLLIKQKRTPAHSFDKYYVLLFFFTGFGTWLLLYCLYWPALNLYDYKYWTFPFPFVFLFLLMAAERTALVQKPVAVVFLVLIFFQLIITWKYATDKTKDRWESDFSYSELKQYRQLGNCGLIADYWFAYSLASASPDSILAIPYEGAIVLRNPRDVAGVFQKNTIYLVKNRWLNDWPADTVEYGYHIVKSGGPFRVERASLCRYKVSE